MTIEDIIEGVMKKPKIPNRPPQTPKTIAPKPQPKPAPQQAASMQKDRIAFIEERVRLMDEKLDVILQQLKNIFDTMDSWKRY